ncbi:MAG: hypothetical protein RLZZ324_522 [Candidatus Parcubacteria bacterium]|jgi:hypothetical protein
MNLASRLVAACAALHVLCALPGSAHASPPPSHGKVVLKVPVTPPPAPKTPTRDDTGRLVLHANDVFTLYPPEPEPVLGVIDVLHETRLIRPQLSNQFGAVGSFNASSWYADLSAAKDGFQPFRFLKLGLGIVPGSGKPLLHLGGTAKLTLDTLGLQSIAFMETRDWMKPWYRVETSMRVTTALQLGVVQDVDLGIGPRAELDLNVPLPFDMYGTALYHSETKISVYGIGFKLRF